MLVYFGMNFEIVFIVESGVTFWYVPIFQYTWGVYTNGIPFCVHPGVVQYII